MSTIEVSNVISELPWVEDANVYGVEVPGIVSNTVKHVFGRHLADTARYY